MKVSELLRKLKKMGCKLVEHGSEHDEWYSPVTRRHFMVPRHKSKELPKGTAISIMRDAGII